MYKNADPFAGTLRNGGLDKEFYSQISQIETDQPQAANVGKISDIYKDNPLPEYSYKESGYDKVADYHSNFGSNPFEMPKNYYQNLDTQDKELFQGFNNDQEEPHHLPSDNSDLFSSIGKKVVLDLLKHRNDSEHQSEDNLKQEFLNKIMGGNPDQNNMGINTLLANRLITTTSPLQTQESTLMAAKPNGNNYHFPTLPSQGKVLTSGKISSKDALGFGTGQITQQLNLPKGINLHIQGHVFQGNPLAPSRMIKDQSPNVPESQGAEKPSLNNLIQSKEGDSRKENYVTLKISGAGKPVSFKAGTSDDGSLVLKIPGNVTLMDTSTNKVITNDVSLNKNENSNSKPEMITDADQMNHFLSQTAPMQEFAKKESMIKNHDDDINKEMLSWQILGKTNTKLDDRWYHNDANEVLQEANRVLSSVRPTRGHTLNDLNQISPTKYNELNRVSFAGVGQSPPSDIFPPSLRLRGSVENNKLLSLKSFLRPSKFIEDSPVNRGRLSFGPGRSRNG